jgi:hypothetical protein
MGMYTDLSVKVKLKPEFVPIIQKVIARDYENVWTNLGYDFMDDYANFSRSGCIPYGFIYEPELKHQLTDGVWQFCCSLKNYDDTIEYFLDNVLSKIIDESYLISYRYEEWVSERLYTFVDGKFIVEQDEICRYYEDCGSMYGNIE